MLGLVIMDISLKMFLLMFGGEVDVEVMVVSFFGVGVLMDLVGVVVGTVLNCVELVSSIFEVGKLIFMVLDVLGVGSNMVLFI